MNINFSDLQAQYQQERLSKIHAKDHLSREQLVEQLIEAEDKIEDLKDELLELAESYDMKE